MANTAAPRGHRARRDVARGPRSPGATRRKMTGKMQQPGFGRRLRSGEAGVYGPIGGHCALPYRLSGPGAVGWYDS
jgi:hypothetical protein